MHTKCEQLSPLGRGRPATSRMLRSRRHSWAAAAAATLGSTLALPPPCAVRRMMQNSNKASPLLGGAGHCCKNLLRQRTASVPRHPPTSSLSAASAPARPLGSSQHVSAMQCRACPRLCSLQRCMCPPCSKHSSMRSMRPAWPQDGPRAGRQKMTLQMHCCMCPSCALQQTLDV